MEERRNVRNNAVNVSVVSAGIQICKMKAVASQFEAMVAFLSFCQADVGNIAHGRYQNWLI